MYNESMMYNVPMQAQIPYCPYMRSMYMMPDMMMRTDDLDVPFPEDIDGDLKDNLREDTSEDNILATEGDIEDNHREYKSENHSEEDIDNSSTKVDYDDNQFRSPAGPDQILRMIERNNPMAIRRLVMYGIPYQVALNMVRRIIYLTLQYHR